MRFAYRGMVGSMINAVRILDESRAVHLFDAALMDEHCALCGLPAAHLVVEQSSSSFPRLRSALCCEHFIFVIGDCSPHLPSTWA
jgi:hypothetical protein